MFNKIIVNLVQQVAIVTDLILQLMSYVLQDITAKITQDIQLNIHVLKELIMTS